MKMWIHVEENESTQSGKSSLPSWGLPLISVLSGKIIWRNIGTKLIGHKIHHHFQLFLSVINFFNCRRLFIFHRLRDAVQDYKKFKQLFNILVNRFKNIMSQNIRFLLMKSLIGFEGGELQSNICQSSITTDLDPSCSVYAKVQLATQIVVPYTKPKIKIAVNMVCLMIYV